MHRGLKLSKHFLFQGQKCTGDSYSVSISCFRDKNAQGTQTQSAFPVSGTNTQGTQTHRPLDKGMYHVPNINVLISQPKHMLWVLKRTVSMRRFF